MSKIVHLTSVHPRFDTRIFLKECRGLALRGYEVCLVVADGLGDECVDSVNIVDVGGLPGRLNRIFRTTHKIYRKAIELDADLYHLHDPELMPIGLCLKLNGKKVIFDAHEDTPKQILAKHYLAPIVRSFVSRAIGQFERFACSRFDGVIAATPYIRDKFLGMRIHAVDVNNFPILGELESSVAWGSKKNEVCYIGSIAKVRGIKELVHSMEFTREGVRLNLVGGFAELDVESEVRGYLGWTKVNSLGVQDRSGVKNALSRSVAGVVTLHPIINYLDSLPIKMFEYMAASIPVIASDFPLWREILVSSDCGVCVDPLDPSAIAEAIDKMVGNPRRAFEMGQNGRRLVETKFNWAREEQKLAQFYGSLLSPA